MFQVEITLGGKPETLKTTLRAARSVNGLFGSYADALERVAKFDLAAYVAIVAAGLDKKVADVEEAVFEAGMPNLVEPLSLFVSSLIRGGRDPNAKAEEAPAGE